MPSVRRIIDARAQPVGDGPTAQNFDFWINDVSITPGLIAGVTGSILDVTVSAIPEPETYAMMLAGVGLVFGIARRRRQRQV